ncbi:MULTISPECIES: HAMP domain-containing methyl-accepting chemotaxis protein [unclassified Rhizobium]|uniref:methyl-accepting chemotaxis protein n=1 Tax=unclassified Rhizobium TaxID=2613769 RepID=UPI00247A0D2B|nr:MULTISPECIES: HAMP domain-containing methyl-accepting chemotaxis protein [unclassified Rhizobium]
MISIFVLLGSLVAAFGYASIEGLRTLNKSTEEFSEHYLPSVHQAHEIAQARFELGILLANHVMQQTQEQKKTAETIVWAVEANLLQQIKAYEPLIATAQEREIFERLLAAIKKYDVPVRRMMDLSYAGKGQAAADVFGTELKAIADEMSNNAAELVNVATSGGKRAQEHSIAVYDSTRNFTVVILLLSLLMVGVAALFAVFGIADPITRITGAMRNLASGNTGLEIPFAERTDEIGAMAGAVEVFRQGAITSERLEREAKANREAAEADRTAMQQAAEADAAERMKIATSGIADGLKRLAAGDLAFQLDETFAPDFEPLRHDFNQSVSHLRGALSAIIDSISTMDSGTREIASGAQDLARRTENQAASLEQTAAALDQITANVGSSTKLTEEARTVAAHANQSAAQSAEVVSHAEDAMRRIEESSQQISNIIGVIDEIAFQTNLLALNAGVEAARAGDAGKGFAVVAQEVRELAQRAARAAKEIKGLIRNSSTEVESGVKLVRDTREALHTIGGFIGQINSHMASIAASTNEQATGLSEVNAAVIVMDQVTQQNAAMVEESTAAAASLALEATKLRGLVAPFRLGGVDRQLRSVGEADRSVASPARLLGKKLVSAFGGRISTAPVTNEWQEF